MSHEMSDSDSWLNNYFLPGSEVNRSFGGMGIFDHA